MTQEMSQEDPEVVAVTEEQLAEERLAEERLVEERVLDLQQQLACEFCTCHLVPLLIRLARVPMNNLILRRTRIGRTLQVLRHRHNGTMAGRVATW